MTIREMQDKVIGKYGFEATQTIDFFRICEGNNTEYIKMCYDIIMK